MQKQTKESKAIGITPIKVWPTSDGQKYEDRKDAVRQQKWLDFKDWAISNAPDDIEIESFMQWLDDNRDTVLKYLRR